MARLGHIKINFKKNKDHLGLFQNKYRVKSQYHTQNIMSHSLAHSRL